MTTPTEELRDAVASFIRDHPMCSGDEHHLRLLLAEREAPLRERAEKAEADRDNAILELVECWCIVTEKSPDDAPNPYPLRTAFARKAVDAFQDAEWAQGAKLEAEVKALRAEVDYAHATARLLQARASGADTDDIGDEMDALWERMGKEGRDRANALAKLLAKEGA